MLDKTQRELWLQKAREGDSLAMSKLLVAFHSVIRARALERMDRVLRSRMEPDDLLQDTYLQATRQISQFEGENPHTFLNWVLTILDNKVVNARQALHRQKRDVAREVSPGKFRAGSSCLNLLDELYGSSGTPSHVVRRGEAVAVLSSCLASLSENHCNVIQLRFLDGLSVDEVAEKMGLTKGAVVALSGRALKALRKSMDAVGEFTRVS